MNKLWYSYTMEYYSARKRNKLLINSVTWMNLIINMMKETRQEKVHTL